MASHQPNKNQHTHKATQRLLSKLFSRDMSEQKIAEINSLIMYYLDTKLQQQVTIDMEKKGITQTDLDNILNYSQRTP